MYPVSDAFLRAVRSNTRKYFWTGTIVTRGGMTYEFGAKEIVKGSGYISRQCCGSTEIELGTVYAAEMGITLLSDIDRYTLEDAQVTLVFHLVLADGSVEDVPMGVFEVSEANRLAKCLELKAYDFMLRFDKSFNGFETVGTAYDFIALCCKRCKVEFAKVSVFFLIMQKEKVRTVMDLMEEMELFQMNTALVKRNIEYDCLVQRCRLGEQQQLDEIVALIVETISIERENITISGVKYPYQFVKSRLLLLEESHIEYVLDCLHENTREVKNIKAYLLTCLMNSITTIGNYYQAKVNHDMYGGDI